MNSCNRNIQIISFSFLIHHPLIFLLLIGLTQFPLPSHGCHEEERKALLDIKSSLQDPSNRLSSWQEGSKYQNCCDWHGIQCSIGSFHIISINLRNTEYEIYFDQFKYRDSRNYDEFNPPETALQGKLSPLFFHITHLQYLDLAFNNFQESQIPIQFSNLTKLAHLDLSNSNFSGSTLTQFANLSSLKYLDLSCGVVDCIQLSSTKWLSGLVNLQVLRLSRINLSNATVLSENNFAEHISFLSNLKDLDLSYCNISGPVFPIQELNNLSSLSSLNMSYNLELNSSFPVHLAKLTSLSSLYLLSCSLHGSVPYMPQLTELNVYSNPNLHVDLAQMFEHKWPKLKFLRISSTKVTGPFQKLISNVPLLEFLYASGCSIQGPIPESLCEISFLRDVFLQRNNFTGTIPSCITRLRYLNRLDISNNSIEGDVSLPSLVTKLNLTSLELGSNKLTVSIDQHLYLYPKLKFKVLGLRSCNLTGLFPTFICNLTDLEMLHLQDNNLSGTISSCIYKLKNLRSLDLSHNNLHGPLPLPCNNAKLYNLAHNKFNGEISMETGKRLSTIISVMLSGNELTGSVPSSICSDEPGLHSDIQILDLSKNDLHGIIPTTIRYCTSLKYLNLGSNNLTGNVPKELEQAKNLQILQLNNNNLDGDPLYFISKLHELVVLDLGNNCFGGSISHLSGTLDKLKILSLRSNKFNESIPKDIVDLHLLHVLDLSGNNLTGLIPKEIGNLIMLTNITNGYLGHLQLQMTNKGIMMQYEKLYTYNSGIDLSSNNLEGEIPEEIGLLKGLSMLNLSHNHLSGNIPFSVGNMKSLESLDLSFNKLSGLIPPSLASMDFLGYLNLSYNNLSGRIPRGPHMDTLSGDGSAYVNNNFLCGYLTKNACEGNLSSDTGNSLNEYGQDKWYFYGIVAFGFIIGFLGLFFGLLLKKDKWWVGYWRAVDNLAVKSVRFFLKN
ncbi:receptor-like protein EIX1 [Papaver somniferum]|uniref:receptor-like protein EIX1 n=1 Tax=Papaver somniferum TaxID=3469 RepID=UPI000E700250|nr:receptor-like protein EIX1 [Papaver somniferum]